LGKFEEDRSMARRTWRKLDLITNKVPDPGGSIWTPVFDYLNPGKTYLLEAASTSKWTPESAGECTADGNPQTKRGDALLVPGAAVGSLVAKINGSSADLTPDKDKAVMFAVGRYCIFTVESGKGGPLFLGANDAVDSLNRVQGHLEVTLSEAL
jgi:hypothetical protein